MRWATQRLLSIVIRLLTGMAAAVQLTMVGSAWALDPDRKLSQLHHTGWLAPDQVPYTALIAQTPDGFLWLGGRGLYRFDGISAERFAAEKLPDVEVTALATDAAGALWAGFYNSTVARITPAGVATYSVPTPKNRTPVFQLVPDPDGTMWVATRDTVFNFDGSTWRLIESPWPPATTYTQPGGVWTMDLARDGTLWAKNLEGLFFLRRGAGAFEQATNYGRAGVGFARDRDGRLWTSDFTSNRFYALPDLVSGQSVPEPQSLGASVPPQILGIIKFDRDGVLWNANRVTGGFHRLTSVTKPVQIESFGMGRDPILYFSTVFEDREGSIWAANGYSVHRFRPAAIAVEEDLRFRTQAPQLLATNDAVYFYSGMNPPIDDPRNEGRRLYRVKPGLEAELVDENFGQSEAMAATPEGSVIFSRAGKIWKLRGGLETEIETPPEVAGGHVVNLVATDGGLVVSVYDRGVWRLEGDHWSSISPPNAPQSGQPEIAIDGSGAAWLFYNAFDRIFRVGPEGPTEVEPHIASALGTVKEMIVERSGLLFAGSKGIARFDGFEFEFLSSKRLPDLAGSLDITTSPDSYVWILANAGIIRISEDELLRAFADEEYRPEYDVLDSDDRFELGPPGDSFGASMVSGPDGRVWFLNGRNVSWIDPARLYRNEQPPPVAITAILAGGRTYTPSDDLFLPQGSSQIEIDYTGLSLTVPEKIRFRYRLSEVDESWIEAGDRRQAFYTNLQPGEYRFQVIAANSAGVWNEAGAELNFRIEPTFLQSIWFKLLVAALLVLTAVVAYVVLLRQQAARMQSRFNVRIAERERIARELHDTLLQSFHGLMMRLQTLSMQMPADSTAKHSINDALQRAEAALVDGRDRVRDLRAEGLKEELADAIARSGRSIAADQKVAFNMIVEGSRRRLHAIVAEELLRIAEEAIRNAAKHANASNISVVLRYGYRLHLSIRDDGRGISRSSLPQGDSSNRFGITGMRERAMRIGAKFDIATGPGGTEIIVDLVGRAAYADSPMLGFQLFGRSRYGD